MEEIKIKTNAKTFLKVILVSSIFIITCLWLIKVSPGEIVVNIVSWMAILTGGIMGVIGIYMFIAKSISKKPGLIINNKGITSTVGWINPGLIKWENVTDISLIKISKQKILLIEVDNNTELLSKLSGFKKKLCSLTIDIILLQ